GERSLWVGAQPFQMVDDLASTVEASVAGPGVEWVGGVRNAECRVMGAGGVVFAGGWQDAARSSGVVIRGRQDAAESSGVVIRGRQDACAPRCAPRNGGARVLVAALPAGVCRIVAAFVCRKR